MYSAIRLSANKLNGEMKLAVFDALKDVAEGSRKLLDAGGTAKTNSAGMVPEGQYPARMEAIKGYFPGDLVPYGAYFALKINLWVPLQRRPYWQFLTGL